MTIEQLYENVVFVDPEKCMKLQKLAEFIATHGVRNNTLLEELHCVCPEFTNARMRELMLSIEKAIETSLLVYESFTEEAKQVILNVESPYRTYDVPRRKRGSSSNSDTMSPLAFSVDRLILCMYVSLSNLWVSKTRKWRRHDRAKLKRKANDL